MTEPVAVPRVDPGTPGGRALAEHRVLLNDVLRRAQALGADPAHLLAAVAAAAPVLGSLVEAGHAAQAPAQQVSGAVAAVAEAVADLAARRRWGAGTAPEWALTQVVPAVARWVIARPGVVRELTTAATPVVRDGAAEQWARRLAAAAAAAPDASADQVRGLVVSAAWRSGLARYRDAALAAAAGLPASLAATVLDLPADAVGDALARQAADRWAWPGVTWSGVGVLRRVGGFRGLGGPWLELPRVCGSCSDGWLVVADGTVWVVVADVHGSATVRTTQDPGSVAATQRWRGRLPVPWQDEVTGVATGGDGSRLLAVSRRHSYLVDLVRLEDPA